MLPFLLPYPENHDAKSNKEKASIDAHVILKQTFGSPIWSASINIWGAAQSCGSSTRSRMRLHADFHAKRKSMGSEAD
jgi:hypothetical protein